MRMRESIVQLIHTHYKYDNWEKFIRKKYVENSYHTHFEKKCGQNTTLDVYLTTRMNLQQDMQSPSKASPTNISIIGLVE